jgi:LuxR family maltose regulon positive regulatory protein
MVNISNDVNYLIRQRINTLLTNAINNPVTTICASTGCGKTRAVSDFLRQQKLPFFWIQVSVNDNSISHFWKSYTEAVSLFDDELAVQLTEIGFPNTPEKINQFFKAKNNASKNKQGVVVFDDFHLLNEPTILSFIENLAANKAQKASKVILIGRDMPHVDIKRLQMKGLASEITETDLNFTELELTKYLKQQNISVDNPAIREIHKDTGGWAFAVSLVVRSLKRVPKYSGFVKATLKPNIFDLMEAENWNELSKNLKHFLASLSLIDHISMDLVEILADGDNEMLSELRQQTAYIHFDTYGGAYIIHSMYLDFLKSKQDLLSEEEKFKTYKLSAEWCKKNNFKIDAFNYYEKLSDYEAIVEISWELQEHTTHDVLVRVAEIMEAAPEEALNSVEFLMAFHLFTLIYLGKLEEFLKLAKVYEKKLLSLTEESKFKNNTLGGIYYLIGHVHFIMCTYNDCYDFDSYYKKAIECFGNQPPKQIERIIISHGAWVSTLGSHDAKAMKKYISVIERSVNTISHCYKIVIGFDDLLHGEIKFYQNDTRGAELLFLKALEKGKKNKQFDTIQRALSYIMRISIMQGNRKKAENMLNELESLLNESEYFRRNFTYDIVFGWYYCTIRQFDMIADWLKNDFTPYYNAHFIDNFSNQVKARYHYLKRDYLPLLSYIGEMKKRESVLYGRIEMLAMEACIHYQMKDKPSAFASLKQAYDVALPNEILTPFIELGKDVRTLAMAALREEPSIGIPRQWLDSLRNKASSYAKSQSMFITENKLHELSVNNVLSAREQDILSDLYHGLSQSEIAKKHSLSINTVKMVAKSIYEKLHVHKISDLIRVAAEQRLV